MTTEQKQKQIAHDMAQDGYYVVTCGDCAKIILVDSYNRDTQQKEEIIDMKCPYCGFVGDFSDFPDLYV